MTIDDNTEITHSGLQSDNTVRVYIETPANGSLNHAMCILPQYEWVDVYGYSQEEIAAFDDFLHHNSHLIIKMAREGGQKIMEIVKYILLTIRNRTVRVAVGIQEKHTPIVYWMEKDNPYSLVFFQGCMTEDEGNQILQAAESNNYAAAIRLFHKYFRGEDSEVVYVEAEGMEVRAGKRLYLPISEVVPDDWFDECDQIMSLMRTNIRDVMTFDRKGSEIWIE